MRLPDPYILFFILLKEAYGSEEHAGSKFSPLGGRVYELCLPLDVPELLCPISQYHLRQGITRLENMLEGLIAP